jgi:hypothetical protein
VPCVSCWKTVLAAYSVYLPLWIDGQRIGTDGRVRSLTHTGPCCGFATNLEAGRDEIEQLLGVRPVLGGRHPTWGTHNALLSLGAATYVEVIAPDPQLEVPERGVLFAAARICEPRLVTWVVRSESIDETAAAACAAGVGIGTIESGSRQSPDGTVISWRLSDPYAMPLGGALPFLISHGAGGQRVENTDSLLLGTSAVCTVRSVWCRSGRARAVPRPPSIGAGSWPVASPATWRTGR